MAVNRIYCATSLTGGGTGALDTIKHSDLADKDMAIVMNQTNVYFYVLDADSGAAESSPATIAPDDALLDGTDERWILQSLYVEDITLVIDDLTVGDDLVVTGDSEFKGAVQIGDADGTGANLTIYSNTVGDYIVFDKAAKTFTLTDIQLIANSVDINGGAIDGTNIGAATPGTIVGTTIDATTDFTIGGTVITDGQILDDGILTITSATAIRLTDSDGAGSAVNIWVGASDSVYGLLTLFADDDTSGPTITLEVPPDNDDNTSDFLIQVNDNSDDLYIGASNDEDMIVLLGGATPSIQFNAGSTFAGTTIADLGTVTTANIDGGTIDGITLFSVATGVSGADVTLITGTAGDAGDLLVWNADGDAVSAASPAQANDFLVASAENTWAVKTLAETGAILEADLDHGSIQGLGDDDHTQYILHSLADAENDFLVASGDNTFVKKTLAETGAILEADLDHGNIQGLGDDDHTQYLLADGSRALAGAWDMGSQNLTNVDIDSGSIDGVTAGSITRAEAALDTINDGLATTDETATGTIISATVDTNTYGYGGVVYLNSADGHWDDADKDAVATAAVQIGMVLSDGTTTQPVLLQGVVRQDAWNWTAGQAIYIGDDGAPTNDVSAYTTDDVVRLIGYALTDDTIYFNPSNDFIVVA